MMSKLTDKKILVTGGTGFIGGRLVEELALRHGARVRVLVRNFGRAARLARLPIEMVAGDVTDMESVRRAAKDCAVVFHCAYGSSGANSERYASTVEGARNVAKAVLENGSSKMIHVSTLSVYGNTDSGDLHENSPRHKTDSLYCNSKFEAEALIMDLCKKEGLQAAIIQPTIVYGPYGDSWTLGTIQELKTGKVVLANGGAGFCNAVYVDDVVNAMILAAECDPAIGECFLISDKEPVTWRDFYLAFQRILNGGSIIDMSPDEIKSKSRPPSLTQKMWQGLRSIRMKSEIVGAVVESPFFSRTYRFLRNLRKMVKEKIKTLRPSDSKRFYLPDETMMNFHLSKTKVRIDKAQKILGYSPLYDFTKGMELTAEWIRWANLD